MEEDTNLCRENKFLRSYYIPILGKQREGCDFSKGDYIATEKIMYIFITSFQNI
jgi:hypothetical protein